jgi:hypothetical protein
MKGSDITSKQKMAAAKYILLRRSKVNDGPDPSPDELITVRWAQLVLLVAEYGAIRAASVADGGSVEEPGEVYLTQARAKREQADDVR